MNRIWYRMYGKLQMSEMFIKTPFSDLFILSTLLILIISPSSVLASSLDQVTGGALKVTFVTLVYVLNSCSTELFMVFVHMLKNSCSLRSVKTSLLLNIVMPL